MAICWSIQSRNLLTRASTVYCLLCWTKLQFEEPQLIAPSGKSLPETESLQTNGPPLSPWQPLCISLGSRSPAQFAGKCSIFRHRWRRAISSRRRVGAGPVEVCGWSFLDVSPFPTLQEKSYRTLVVVHPPWLNKLGLKPKYYFTIKRSIEGYKDQDVFQLLLSWCTTLCAVSRNSMLPSICLTLY